MRRESVSSVDHTSNSISQSNPVTESSNGPSSKSNVCCYRCLQEDIGEHIDATNFCNDCKVSLCDTHIALHNKAKKNKDHSVVPIMALASLPVEIQVGSFCSKHFDEKLKFYCCDELICRDCAVNEHRQHEFKEIELVANEERGVLKQLVMQSQKDIPLVEKTLSDVVEMLERIQDKCIKDCEKIETVAKELKDHIDQRAASLANEIKAIVRLKKESLEQQRKNLNEILLNVKTQDDIQLIENAGDIELLRIKKQLDQKHRELQEKWKKSTKMEHGDTFDVQLEAEDLITNIQHWGNVSDDGMVSVDHCIVSGIENNATVGQEAQFTIQLKASNDKFIKSRMKPNVMITDPEQQSVDYLMHFNEQECRFEVSYTPKKGGLYSIQILINGQYLKNSPFSIQVVSVPREPVFEFKASFGSEGTDNLQFRGPALVATSKQGDIYVSDFHNHRVQIFDKNGQWKQAIGSYGVENGQFNNPMGIVFNSNNDLIVVDQKNHRVEIFNENMEFVKAFGSKGSENGQLDCPCGIAVDASDNIIVADYNNNCVQIFDKDGNWKRTIGKKGSDNGEFSSPSDVCVCKTDGRIYVSDYGNDRIQVFNSEGEFLFKFGSKGSENNQFQHPCGIELSRCGKYLLVCDSSNHRIQVFSSMNGAFIKSYGAWGSEDGQFKHPCGVCVTPSNQIIITDWGNSRIQLFN
jgi:DNA-binding beta-propeller fold protein YncE